MDDTQALIEYQADRIRALEMIVGVMAKAIEAMHGSLMDELRDTIDHRLSQLEAAEQLPGPQGGASQRSLKLARSILGEAPQLRR